MTSARIPVSACQQRASVPQGGGSGGKGRAYAASGRGPSPLTRFSEERNPNHTATTKPTSALASSKKGTCHETTPDAAKEWPYVDMAKTPTVPRGTDLTALLPVGPQPGNDQPALLPHSKRPGVAWAAGNFGHGAPTDLAGAGVRAALAAHPEAALRDTQAPTLDDQRRLHEMTGFVPTRLALAAAVENLQKEQLGRQALHEHGYGPHVQGMRTAAAVSACPLVLERPHGPGAAAAPAQPLPVGTWGVGLAPRAAAVGAPAVAALAAAPAASAARLVSKRKGQASETGS